MTGLETVLWDIIEIVITIVVVCTMLAPVVLAFYAWVKDA